jgi:membrane-bound serine protease (ClpP class)
VAWARALADHRGRNKSDWAGRAVRDSISTPANEALHEGIIDFIATDQEELLRKLDGRTIALTGRSVVLQTRGAIVERVEMSWPERWLSLLANPTIAYLLLLVGFAGLMFEITHPGSWIAGILGLICLILAFFAMQMLPINYAGLGLIVLGLLLIVLELKVHSFGILTATSIVCLLLGAAMLIEPVGGVERVSWFVVAPVTVAFGADHVILGPKRRACSPSRGSNWHGKLDRHRGTRSRRHERARICVRGR